MNKQKNFSAAVSRAVQQFDSLAASAVVSINDACAITGRSRASIYRHINAGQLRLIKINSSSRVRVGELRKLIGAA